MGSKGLRGAGALVGVYIMPLKMRSKKDWVVLGMELAVLDLQRGYSVGMLGLGWGFDSKLGRGGGMVLGVLDQRTSDYSQVSVPYLDEKGYKAE